MFARRWFQELVLLSVATAIVGCANPQGLDSIQISPATQALQVGQTAQFLAVGTFGNANHTSTSNVTTGVTWTSSAPAVATVNSSGLATAVGAGTTTITANAAAFNGSATSTATLTVTGSSGGTAGGTITAVSVIPSTQAVAAPGQTTQFIAIGSTSSGATVFLSNQVAWTSSSTSIGTIGATTGLATAVGKGSTTITAIYNNAAGGTVVTGSATFLVTGGVTQQYTGISITPSTQLVSASGQTTQLVALATSGTTGLLQDVTTSSQIKWTSSVPSIASIGATTGIVTGVSTGNVTISALLTNSDGSVVSSTASIGVTLTPAPEPLLSLTIIPSDATLLNLGATTQFIAIGTYAVAPYVRDLTNSPNLLWMSSVPNVMTINTNTAGNYGATAGIATAKGAGTATIIAEVTNPSDGTIQTATASFSCPQAYANLNGNPPTPGTCVPGTEAAALLSTLTIYNKGLNTTNWLVTAPSATGTATVIHCGPGWNTSQAVQTGSVCVATYPVGSSVLLTAPPQSNAFGGWSSNCVESDAMGHPLKDSTGALVVPPAGLVPGGPNYCTVSLTTDDVVGAIFNNVSGSN